MEEGASRREKTQSAETRVSKIGGRNSHCGEAVTERSQHLFNCHHEGMMAEDKLGPQVLRLTVLWFNSLWKVAGTRDSCTIACRGYESSTWLSAI